MKNKIYEHLKTRRKYNTLQLKYDVKCDELDRRTIELNTEKRVRIKQQELYESKIKELTEELIDKKQEITKLRKEIKGLKKNGK